MLDLFLDDSHRALAASAARFVDTNIRPYAEAWEEAGAFPLDLAPRAGAAGLLGPTYPEAVGGGGGDVFHGLVVAEALVRGGSVGTAMGLGSHAIALPPILSLGTDAQKERFVRPVIAGERVAALAITEPSGGSDVARVRTRAVRDGDHFVVSGQKTYITSGGRADFVVTAVRTGAPDSGHAGLSLLVIERGTPGFTSGPPLRKMGWWASDTTELFFDDCRVPVGNLLGAENFGFYAIMANFAQERLLIAATCVAMAAEAIRLTERHVREREAFGRRIGDFQVIRHRLAEMRTREAEARSFVAVVAERHRRGEDVTAWVAMAKNAAVSACSSVTDAAVQLHGGLGYMRECGVERLYRDARLFAIGGGTTEIMNEIIHRFAPTGR